MSDPPPPGASAPAPASSAWAPFHHRLFAAMWGAQFVSNIGSWMQTVGAQWLMLTLTGSATYVALVQTAAGLPVVLFAVLAGTIGDLVDRRRFLLITQAIMLLASTALGALAIAGLVSPWVLLALIFAVGTGQALTSPTWQTMQPELVSPAERPQAISLGSVNQNLARAVGPAIGGLILAATSAGTLFLINAASFVAVIAVIAAWHSTRAPDALPREHVGEAVRAGARYVAASPILRVIMARAALFIFFASAIWALLPLTARSVLHLGSGGYGLLLGSVGIGAVGGAALLPRLRVMLSADGMLAVGSVGLAVVTLLLAFAHVTAVAVVVLVVGGACWVLALSTLNSAYQLSLPQWVKARGMSFYLVVFQGGGAVGSAVMGLSAQAAGLSTTLTIAGVGLALGPLAALRWRFRPLQPTDVQPASDWPAPLLAPGTSPVGPVLVSVGYRARRGREDELMSALQETRFSRRRTGATSWRAWQDAADPGRILEQFVVASWDEHLRQHERVSQHDQERLDRVRQLTDPAHPVTVTHWLAAEPRNLTTDPSATTADLSNPAAGPSTTAADLSNPAADPSNPAVDPSTTAADLSNPAADPSTTAADLSNPAADPSTTAPDLSNPAVDPSTTAADLSNPATDPGTTAADLSNPAADPSDPAAGPSNPAPDPRDP